MTERVERLIAEITQLPPDERMAVLEGVRVASLTPDPELEEVWLREVEARRRAYLAGRAETIGYDELQEHYLK